MTPKRLRSFGLIVGMVFAGIAIWPLLWRGESLRFWAVGVAGALVVPALVYPRSLRAVYRVWMVLGEGLGWLNTRIILGTIFYGLFTPVALLRRSRGGDHMQLRWEPKVDTYRVVRQPRARSHMTRQF
jgi:hypothetical protein